MTESSPGLQVDIGSMHYSDAEGPVIQNLSLHAEPGEILTVLGPSGVGKTTLLRIVAGLERRYTGQVTVGGKRVSGPGRIVQLMFQDYRLLPWLSVVRNVTFAMDEQASASEKVGTAVRWLQKVGLAGKADAWPLELSGGEQARVALARAFAGQPTVLLVDEPFGNVDVGLKRHLRRTLVEYSRSSGSTVLMVTHNIEDALDVSDRICVFTSRPMSDCTCVAVGEEHPRDLQGRSLQELGAEIVSQLIR